MRVHSNYNSSSEENGEETALLNSNDRNHFLCMSVCIVLIFLSVIIVLGVKLLQYTYPKGPPQVGY